MFVSPQVSAWEFVNGGDRLKLPSGKEQKLTHPLLVLDGKHFIPLEECADALGYVVVREPRLLLVVAGEKIDIEAKVIDSKYHGHKVENLQPIHEVVVVREPVRGIGSYHKTNDSTDISSGTVLLLRRKVTFDGKSCIVATECGPELRSYLVDDKELRQKAKAGKLEGQPLDRCRQWFDAESVNKSALQHGDREQLKKSVAVTIDLCWSLRRYETGLFQLLRQSAGKAKIHPVLFVSGRWLEQHPQEMNELIQLSLEPNIEITWGLHSWDHPKSGGFMNDYPPEKLREDTLRLESLLLEWGVVPTVYYRFPGLIHDQLRLREILQLDLFPIDCDSWLALVERQDSSPFCNQVRNGSIILVHGNGNEPDGIPRLQHWLAEHPDWEIAHLNRFLPLKK